MISAVLQDLICISVVFLEPDISVMIHLPIQVADYQRPFYANDNPLIQ